MRRWHLAAGAWCVAVVALGRAAEPPPVPPSPPVQAAEVLRLIDQLGAESYRDREAAVARLESFGPEVLPPLQDAARANPDPEVRDRAARLYARLARRHDSHKLLTVKRVRLDYDNTPLAAAVHDLQTRTGLPLVLDSRQVADPLRRVTCRTGELTVWQALEVFCSAAGLREVFAAELEVPKPTQRRAYVLPPQPPLAESVPIVLVDGRPEPVPGDRSTAVRVLVLPPTFPGHRSTLGTGELELCFDVTPTPGTHWRGVRAVRIHRLTDDRGGHGGGCIRPPQSPPAPAPGIVFVRPGVALRLDLRGEPVYPETWPNPRVTPVPLRLGDPSARSLRRLEGSVFGELRLPDQCLLVIDEPGRNLGRTYTGPDDLRAVLVDHREPSGARPGMLTVLLKTPSPWQTNLPGGAVVWFQPPPAPDGGPRLELVDEFGRVWAPVATSVNLSDDGTETVRQFQLTYRAGPGRLARVRVVGERRVGVEVPFVIENVPLP